MTGQPGSRAAVNTGQGEHGTALHQIGDPHDSRLWACIANGLIRDSNASIFPRRGKRRATPVRNTVTRRTACRAAARGDRTTVRLSTPTGCVAHIRCLPAHIHPLLATIKQQDSRAYQPEGKTVMAHSLSARHTLVGALLRQYRQNLGYNLDDAARILECDRSKISRIETGKRGIHPKELRELLTEYGVDAATQVTLVTLTRSRGTDGWWRDYHQILGDGYLDFVIAERAATCVSVYAPLLVPDLLRTEAYAKSVAAADPTIPEDSEHPAVEAALVRQATILRERRTDCTVVLGEAALSQQVGDTDVHRNQLAYLADLSTNCPWVTIRILPFTADANAAGSGGFSVLRFKAAPALGLVHISGPAGGICLDDAAVISSYATVFTQLSCFALSPEQSAEKLRRLAK